MKGMNPILSSMSEVEKEIFEIWKEFDPAAAFTAGLEDHAGKLFIPSETNINSLKAKIEAALGKVEQSNQKKILQCMNITLEFQEPHKVISTARDVTFAHIVKEGINPQHLLQLAENVEKAITTSKEMLQGEKWATELKVVTCQCSDELKGLLKTIVDETKDQTLQKKIAKLIDVVNDYRKTFEVEGIVEGDFTEVFPILEKSGGDLGHKTIYPKILRYMFDYYETPQQIETKALRQLRKEFPLFKKAISKLAKVYGCSPTVEEVTNAIIKKSEIPKAKIMEFVSNIRKKILAVLGEDLVRITPKYDTRVIETPSYLVNFIPTAATSAFNLLTDKPFSIFFLTADEKRSPPTGAADMIQTIVHEETGHCVHYQNSSTAYGGKPDVVDLFDTYLGYSISDGISFHREYEFLALLKKLAARDESELSNDEKDFLDAIKGSRNLNDALLENEFILMHWRLVRFLRAIFDSRVNMGKQTVVEFVKWASKETGIQEKTIFNQTFMFLDRVGYAPVYFIVGDVLREIQEKALKKGVNLVDFNTYATSIGYGARTHFEKRLEEYIKEKQKRRR
jgi:hypothetical protein